MIMGQNIVLTGIVLHAMPIGEYDRRVTILTRERGKISAFARGARRPTSQLLAATSPFSFGEFEFFEGRSTYNLLRAGIKNYFRELSLDPVAVCYGFYFLEAADYFSQENNDEIDLLKLLYQTLRALESDTFDNSLVRRIFELKALQIEGVYPNFFSCQICGKREKLNFFSIKYHGMVCQDCPREQGEFFVEESALYTMQYIVSSDIGRLYTFAVSKEVLSKLSMVLNRYFAVHISHKFKSLDILKTMEEAALHLR